MQLTRPTESMRDCADLMNTFFAIDEQTDNEPLDIVQERCDMCVDAVMNPQKPRPEGENILGEVTRQYVETVKFR
jgi:DNA-binding FrmR family transcriptional regulator